MGIIALGLSGKAGCGKDTLAAYFVKKHGFIRLAFADGIKDHCREFHNWNGEKDDEGRRLLQTQGAEVHRSVYFDVWLDIVRIKLRMLLSDGFERFVISDMRFENEWDFFQNGLPNESWIKNFDVKSKTVRIEGRMYKMSNEAMMHKSETALDNLSFDFTVENKGTLNDLYVKADEIVERLV